MKRKQLGLTQDELAELLRIGQQSMSRIERGVMAPKFERLQEIAQMLHCSVPELFIAEKTETDSTEVIIRDILNGLELPEKNAVLRFVSDAAFVFRSVR